MNLGLHQRDVSVIWDLGPHDFSILLHWLGERPDTVRATGRDSIVKGVADVAFVTLRFPSGIVAQVELSWLSPSKLRRTVVVGSEKMVVYEDGAPEPIRLFDHGVVYTDPETFGEYQLSYRTGDIVSPKLDTQRAAQRRASGLRAAHPHPRRHERPHRARPRRGRHHGGGVALARRRRRRGAGGAVCAACHAAARSRPGGRRPVERGGRRRA